MKVLVTGGCGFIGSNFINMLMKERPKWEVINVDVLTYAGNPHNLKIEKNSNYDFFKVDISHAAAINDIFRNFRPDKVVNFAAESHVDRSISDPSIFLKTNVFGTYTLLEAAKKYETGRFLHVSTDEVYGSLGETGLFTEKTPYAPNSPYSASKASSDFLVRAYHHTYGMDVVTTNCSNNYGPYQHREKLIPLIITNLVDNLNIPIYGDGLNIRDWLHVEDHCNAILLALENGKSGEVYNIGGNNERTNLQIVHKILDLMGKDSSYIQFVNDRQGHDRRYAIDASKIMSELGWKPKYNFDSGIEQTVKWYIENESWWR